MVIKEDSFIIRNCVLNSNPQLCPIIKDCGPFSCGLCIISRFKGLGPKYLICAYKRYVDYNKNRRIPF